MFGRRRRDDATEPGTFDSENLSTLRPYDDATIAPTAPSPAAHDTSSSSHSRNPPREKAFASTIPTSKHFLSRATRWRTTWSYVTSLLLLISFVFLILVEIGDTSTASVPSSIYVLNLDVSDIVPQSVPNALLINSIAQSLGLHDFYTFGLWGFCEGDFGVGVTYCSPPQLLYWFNPVQILREQLLAGATVALPAEVLNILNLIEIVSHWMFGLFLAGACLIFVLIFLVLLNVYTRWASFALSIFTFLGALFITVAAAIATAMGVIFVHTITSVSALNIHATLGIKMLIFMWIAAGTAILAWLIQSALCCCCASRRDVRTGRKEGRRKAWEKAEAESVR